MDTFDPTVKPPALDAHEKGYAVIKLRTPGSQYAEHLRNPRTGVWEKTGRTLIATGKEPTGSWQNKRIIDAPTLSGLANYGVNCALSGIVYLDIDTKAVQDPSATTTDAKRDIAMALVAEALGLDTSFLWSCVCNYTLSGGLGVAFRSPEGSKIGTAKGLLGGVLDTRAGWVDAAGSAHGAGQFVGPGSVLNRNAVTGWSTYGGELPPIDSLPVLPESARVYLEDRPAKHREEARASRVARRNRMGVMASDPARELEIFLQCAEAIAHSPDFDVTLRHGCFLAALVCAGLYHDGADYDAAQAAFIEYARHVGENFGQEWVDSSGVVHDWTLDANERLFGQAVNWDAGTRRKLRGE